ncbi:MAG: hypothetical protein AAF384_12555, partial [Pseudomonadota bacterium]
MPNIRRVWIRPRPCSTCSAMHKHNLLVVKLGGSILGTRSLGRCLEVLTGLPVDWRCVVVCGGGAAANTVREVQKNSNLDDGTASDLAIRAMGFNAQLLATLDHRLKICLDVDTIKKTLLEDVVTPIWAPADQGDFPGLPRSWDVTSDSLSVALAQALDAPYLLLVKAAQQAGEDLVDEKFRELAGQWSG